MIFSGARIKDILNYAISSVGKKPDYAIPYKSELEWSTGSKEFHQRKTSRWQKEYFVNANHCQWQWKSQDVPHIIYDDIIQKQLCKHDLYLNRIDFDFLRISLKTK